MLQRGKLDLLGLFEWNDKLFPKGLLTATDKLTPPRANHSEWQN